jgi:hypothetical protein
MYTCHKAWLVSRKSRQDAYFSTMSDGTDVNGIILSVSSSDKPGQL